MRILFPVIVAVSPFFVSADNDNNLHGNSGEMRQLDTKIFCSLPRSSSAVMRAVPIFVTVNSLPAAVTRTSQSRTLSQSDSSKVAEEVAPESITHDSKWASIEVKNTKLKYPWSGAEVV